MSVVAITGCSGYIGSRLLRLLADDEQSQVLGLDIRPPAVNPENLSFTEMDVRDTALADLFARYEVKKVVHLAFVVDPMHDEKLMHDIDVNGTRNVLKAAAARRVEHLVVASSTSAFGAFPDNPPWFTEDDETRRYPGYTYASDKWDIEVLTRLFAYENPGTRVAVVRPCIVFGPNVSNYLSSFMLDLPVIPGVGGARPDMQFVHEDDVAEVFKKVVKSDAAGRFHAVGEGVINLSEIARMAGKRIIDVPPRLLFPLTDLLWKMRVPRVTGPSGMLDFIRYRWTASDDLTRENLGLERHRSSREVVKETLETHGVAVRA